MRKLAIIGLICLVCSGCVNREKHDIEFKQTHLEVGISTNGCLLVDKVNQVKIKNEFIQDNHILLPSGLQIDCPIIDVDKVGKQRLTYEIQGQKITHDIYLQDTTTPVIKSEDNYVVEKGNKYFDLKKIVTVYDNFDTHPSLEVDGFVELDRVGKYSVKLIARDEQNNETVKEVTVEVIEKEKEIVIQQVETQSTTNQTAQNSPSPDSSNNNNSGNDYYNPEPQPTPEPVVPAPTPQPQPTASPQEKFFSFSEYGSFNDTLAVCQAWITNNKATSQSASCWPVEDSEGIYTGYQGSIY